MRSAPQNPFAFSDSVRAAQLGSSELRARRSRFFGGAISRPVTPAPTAIAMSRSLLQAQAVTKELSLAKSAAGPGSLP